MIANNSDIVQAINEKKIVIKKYTYSSSSQSLSKTLYKEDDLNGSHKIRLHVGFLVRTLSKKKWINPKHLYQKQRDGIVDLRKISDNNSEQIYVLEPNETVILYTNEVVALNGEFFGLLLSKVSHEEKGLIVSTSYIDPNWNSVLQLVVTNNSEFKQALKLGCEIANLVLIKMDTQSTTSNHSTNSHYGIDWDKIFNDTHYPKWADRKRTLCRKLLHKIRTYWVLSATIGLVGIIGIIANIFDIISKIIGYLSQ